LINSAWLGSPVGTEEGIRLTREIGFDTIDILIEPDELDARERRLIRETCVDTGLPVVSLPVCALGIADFSAPVRRFHIARAREVLNVAYDLHAENMLLVVGEYLWQQEVIKPEDQWKWAVEGVRALGEHAAALDLKIGLELEPFKLSIINSAAAMKRFLDDVNHPAVLANLDISHLALVHDHADQIRLLQGRIAHVHLSDCDGRKHGDLPPGRGVVDFPPYLGALRDAGFDGTISIELEYSPDPAAIVAWVEEAYTATNELMGQLGIRQTPGQLAPASF
jgi:sugar phosphate isomerase/epimerase